MEVGNRDNHKKRKKIKLDERDSEKIRNLSSRSKTLNRHMEVENRDNHKKRKKIKLDERDSEQKSHISSEKRKKKIKLADHVLEPFGEGSRETCIDKDRKEEKKKKKTNKTAGNGSMEEGGCIEDYKVHHEKRKSRKNMKVDDASEQQTDGGPHSLIDEKERKKNKKTTKVDKSGSEENNVREGKEIKKKEKEKTANIKQHVLKEGNGSEEAIGSSNDVIKKKKKKKKSKSKEHGTLEETIRTEEAHFSNDSKRKDQLMKKMTSEKRGTKKNVQVGDHSESPTSIGTSKRVSFSDNVEIFSLPDDRVNDKSSEEDGGVEESDLVQGKRFSKQEDEIVKKAVLDYIETHDLGDKGLHMVLHCKSFPEIKHCWKEIGAALPWRPSLSIYYRAHVLFERDETRKWTQEELEIVRRYHQEHGSDWRKLADKIGKYSKHVKDAWRRIKLPDMKKGRWSQEEYQTLYDLVNVDLRMKAFEEKKSKHGMLRDNIPWESISDRLATRTNATCCNKWYRQLTSPMVAEGVWADVDDYHLVDALCNLDACSMEDVDWDNLLNHRPGDVCRKRWNQMVKHIGEKGSKSFSEQVDILSERYCSNVIEAKEAYDARPFDS